MFVRPQLQEGHAGMVVQAQAGHGLPLVVHLPGTTSGSGPARNNGIALMIRTALGYDVGALAPGRTANLRDRSLPQSVVRWAGAVGVRMHAERVGRCCFILKMAGDVAVSVRTEGAGWPGKGA